MEEEEKLRESVKAFKVKSGLPYSFLARQIGLKKQSFYNYIGGAKGLSKKRQRLLKEKIRRFE